ncbi:MAG: hypothetical protein PCFJNLEI_02392 [Verrucomicrobiae bacterium]|nr:hypothetical protein [Verrucomicrobiae bacterium]
MYPNEILRWEEPLHPKMGRQQSRLRRSLERPVLTAFPSRHLERPCEQSRIEKMERKFLRIVNSKERCDYTAEFGFDLMGVVWNGRIRQPVEGRQTLQPSNGDRLISRLLPKLDNNAIIRFEYGGGGNTNFHWSIRAAIRGASSPKLARSAAGSLRTSLQMVLASEPGFSFTPIQFHSDDQDPPPQFTWETKLVPQQLLLPVVAHTPIGFGGNHQQAAAPACTLTLPAMSTTTTSFKSLAEAVALSASPVLLAVSFTRFALDDKMQAIISSTLDWLERDGHVAKRLSVGSLVVPENTGHIHKLLTAWLRQPWGCKVQCHLYFTDWPADAFVQMIGNDVFGTQVKSLSQLAEEGDVDKAEDEKTDDISLDLTGCIRTGQHWPSLFPGFESLANARVRRLFNHDISPFGDSGILLGSVAEDKHRDVRLQESARAQHLYVLGATGTGKSTLLFNMILQDIRADRGVGLIDPHGDLYDQLLEAMPRNRAKDVFLFSPGNPDGAPGINPLECNEPNRSMQINFAINELLKTFDRLYDMRECGGPMFEMYFRNAMLLLLESDLPVVTLTELSLVFEDAEYRKFLKSRCKNSLVVSFWSNQAERVHGEASLANIAPYIVSKINAFTCNALIRPIIGQAKSTIPFRRIMNTRKILLMKLPKGILGELDTQLLGSFLLSKMFATAMQRAGMNLRRRNAFHLYVDEFQNFTNDTVAHMLSEARKYGLYLTLANQNLSQLLASAGRQNILDAVLGNVGNLITFRVGPTDAERLWPYIEPEFSGLDVQGLPNYHAIGRLLTAQGPTRPFVFHTHPAVSPKHKSRATSSLWEQRERSFTIPTVTVEAQIVHRREIHKAATSSKTKKAKDAQKVAFVEISDTALSRKLSPAKQIQKSQPKQQNASSHV